MIAFLLEPTLTGIAVFTVLIVLLMRLLWKRVLSSDERVWILARIPLFLTAKSRPTKLGH